MLYLCVFASLQLCVGICCHLGLAVGIDRTLSQWSTTVSTVGCPSSLRLLFSFSILFFSAAAPLSVSSSPHNDLTSLYASNVWTLTFRSCKTALLTKSLGKEEQLNPTSVKSEHKKGKTSLTAAQPRPLGGCWHAFGRGPSALYYCVEGCELQGTQRELKKAKKKLWQLAEPFSIRDGQTPSFLGGDNEDCLGCLTPVVDED